MRLLEQQRQWMRSMYQTEGLSVGMRAYQRNFLGNHGNALALTYSRTYAALGDACFRYYAQQYLCKFPVRSGDLNDYGQDFYQLFLAVEEPDRQWLADLARVEWALLQSLLAPDDATTSVLSLQQKDYLQTGTVTLSKTCQRLSLSYPVHELLGSDELVTPILLASRTCQLLLYRQHDEIRWRELSAEEAHFIDALEQHQHTVSALTAVLQGFPEFLPGDILMFLLGKGLLIKEEST